MKKAIWMVAAATMLALPLAAGTASAVTKSKAPPPPVDSTNPDVQKDNTKIQTLSARITADCQNLASILFIDQTAANMDFSDIRDAESSLGFWQADKFAVKNGLPRPDKNTHAFDYQGDDYTIQTQVCGIGAGGDGGGG